MAKKDKAIDPELEALRKLLANPTVEISTFVAHPRVLELLAYLERTGKTSAGMSSYGPVTKGDKQKEADILAARTKMVSDLVRAQTAAKIEESRAATDLSASVLTQSSLITYRSKASAESLVPIQSNIPTLSADFKLPALPAVASLDDLAPERKAPIAMGFTANADERSQLAITDPNAYRATLSFNEAAMDGGMPTPMVAGPGVVTFPARDGRATAATFEAGSDGLTTSFRESAPAGIAPVAATPITNGRAVYGLDAANAPVMTGKTPRLELVTTPKDMKPVEFDANTAYTFTRAPMPAPTLEYRR